MGVEIGEASQDGPYLFKLYSMEKIFRRKLAPGRIWSQLADFQNHALLPIPPLGDCIGWYIGRVDNWTGRWDNIAKAIDSSKNIVLYNATVGNREDIAGKITKNHIIITGQQVQENPSLAQIIF